VSGDRLRRFDMNGNVWEWCWDGYEKYDAKSPAVDPTGAAGAPDRVARGGCWGLGTVSTWTSLRNSGTRESRGYIILGFRVARGQFGDRGGVDLDKLHPSDIFRASASWSDIVVSTPQWRAHSRKAGALPRRNFLKAKLLEWAMRDSNPRLPACKAGALTN
jgi:Sulfatase-modifying factor enzyme 1